MLDTTITDNIVPFPLARTINRASEKSLMDQIKEDMTFLAGALRCTIDLEDKSKVPEALELCMDLLRSIYGDIKEATHA